MRQKGPTPLLVPVLPGNLRPSLRPFNGHVTLPLARKAASSKSANALAAPSPPLGAHLDRLNVINLLLTTLRHLPLPMFDTRTPTPPPQAPARPPELACDCHAPLCRHEPQNMAPLPPRACHEAEVRRHPTPNPEPRAHLEGVHACFPNPRGLVADGRLGQHECRGR